MRDQALTQYYLTEHERFAKVSPSVPCLSEKRKIAIQAFCDHGFPTIRDEDWRYTKLPAMNYPLIDNEKVSPKPIDSTLLSDASTRLVFINGTLSDAHSRIPNNADDGILILDLASAIRTQNPIFLQYLENMSEDDLTNEVFSALNIAFMRDGVFIHLADEQVVNEPVHIYHLTTIKSPEPFAMHPRHIFFLGKNSSLQVIEYYNTLDEACYFNNVVTDVSLDAGANLAHYKLQESSANAVDISRFNALQKKDSHLVSHVMTLGKQGLVRNDIYTQLLESGAQIKMNGLYVTSGKKHVDNHTYVDHIASNTTSQQDYRGVLDDHSRAVFNGKVLVNPDAQQINAQQYNANLLLSSDAEIDTKPEMEINANDVKCSHGATVSKLDDETLFYLRSRAIDKEVAQHMMLIAFLQPLLDEIEDPLHEQFQACINRYLPNP